MFSAERKASQSGAPARRPRVTLVVAAGRNGVIGRENGLPWKLPDDLRRFKALTVGKPVLMGRLTFDSIGRPLPDRTNYVLTRRTDFSASGVTVVHSLADALARVGDSAELMVIGGADVYRQALPIADRIELTRVHADVDGDAYFPEPDSNAWREVARTEHAADERHAYAMTWLTLERF